jgi:hypothetical protein
MGVGMRAAVRSQINLVMNAAEHVKQLRGVRDIVYPILWFQVIVSTPLFRCLSWTIISPTWGL